MSPIQANISSENYFEILGVSRQATESDISKAYKTLALKYHPDTNPDDRTAAAETFKKISQAYSVLSDADQRQTCELLEQACRPSRPGASGGTSAGFSGWTDLSSEEKRKRASYTQIFGGVGLRGGPPAGTQFVNGAVPAAPQFSGAGMSAEQKREVYRQIFTGGGLHAAPHAGNHRL